MKPQESPKKPLEAKGTKLERRKVKEKARKERDTIKRDHLAGREGTLPKRASVSIIFPAWTPPPAGE